MSAREKLIELLVKCGALGGNNTVRENAEFLIANGVTVKAEEGDTELRLFQLTRECERLKSKNDDLAKAINALNCENSLLIEKIRSERTQRWIPVTERLPEEHGIYLCHAADGFTSYITMMHFYERRFAEGGRYTYNVTHWMPLPEPPKEG